MAKRTPDKLVEDWFHLLDFCNNGGGDQKLFRQMVDSWAKEWSKSTNEEQGYCSEQISNELRRMVDASYRKSHYKETMAYRESSKRLS